MILSTSLELRLLTNILSAPLTETAMFFQRALKDNSCGEKTELNRTLIDVGISAGQVASHSLYIISKGLLRFRKIQGLY